MIDHLLHLHRQQQQQQNQQKLFFNADEGAMKRDTKLPCNIHVKENTIRWTRTTDGAAVDKANCQGLLICTEREQWLTNSHVLLGHNLCQRGNNVLHRKYYILGHCGHFDEDDEDEDDDDDEEDDNEDQKIKMNDSAAKASWMSTAWHWMETNNT